MRTTTKTINGLKVSAYNDSGSDWVVKAGDVRVMRFDVRKWALKNAMEFAAEIAAKQTLNQPTKKERK